MPYRQSRSKHATDPHHKWLQKCGSQTQPTTDENLDWRGIEQGWKSVPLYQCKCPEGYKAIITRRPHTSRISQNFFRKNVRRWDDLELHAGCLFESVMTVCYSHEAWLSLQIHKSTSAKTLRVRKDVKQTTRASVTYAHDVQLGWQVYDDFNLQQPSGWRVCNKMNLWMMLYCTWWR